MSMEEDAAGHLAEQLIVKKLTMATRRAEELGLDVNLRKKMEYISGYMSNDYPGLSNALLRIYQPVG